MAPLILEGNSLGQRHRHYNRLLKEALASNQGATPDKISHDDNDIDNFLKIDIASHNRDVAYILEVLKCKDLLYVTRAIKKSRWLITDDNYAHVINPKYLHKELFPHMMPKAKSKLLLHIRLQLRDEKRNAHFYNYCKQFDDKLALKWLQNCSLQFALNEVHNHAEKMTLSTLKRLCRRSFDFLTQVAGISKKTDWEKKDLLREVQFLIRNNPEEYLKITDSSYNSEKPVLKNKHLVFIMKTCPQRILNNFKCYFEKVDYSILVKYMDKASIKQFLLKCSKDEDLFDFISCHKVLVKFLPKLELNDRMEVLKAFFATISGTDWQGPNGFNNFFSTLEDGVSVNSPRVFRWYQCMPFDIAFREMTKIIENEVDPDFRMTMIKTLLICAGSDLKNLLILLKYYHEKHVNESYKSKAHFVNQILSRVATYKFDTKMWTLLDNLFCSMEVYKYSNFKVSKCVEVIIVYKISHDQIVPETIESNFKFKNLKSYKNKLKTEECDKLFNYLYKIQLKSFDTSTISTEKKLRNVVKSLERTMTLLKDWNKNIISYPLLINKIRKCIKINKQNNWDIDLSTLYNIHKPWRRYLFDNSLMLYPSKLVLINALKHNQNMLSLYKKEVNFIRNDEKKSLEPLLSKLKIYCSDTLAKEWINEYLLQLKETGKQKNAIKNLAVLLPQKDFLKIAKQYIPQESKIDWKDADEVEYNCRKYFASNIHRVRPLPATDTMLWFTKGDYLRFALTSLSATFANLSHVDREEYFSKLTLMQVSLQKYSIHMAFALIDVEKLVPIIEKIWKSTTNQTIQTIIYSSTHDLLCQQSKKSKILKLWKLLDFIIANLSTENSKIIDKMKCCLKDVPEIVQPKYCKKAYFYFKTLPNKHAVDADNWIISHATRVYEFLDGKFIEDFIMKTIDNFPSQSCSVKELFAKYLFSIGNTESELDTYERLIKPLFYKTENFSNFKAIVFEYLPSILREYVPKNKTVPVNLFKRLLDDFKQKLCLPEDYVALKTWELICDFVEILQLYVSPTIDNFNIIFNTPVLSDFGKSCSQHLQRDTKTFPFIIYAFDYVLTDVFTMLKFTGCHQLQLYKYMLGDQSIAESYLLVQQKILNVDFSEYGMYELKQEIIEILCSNPSRELQMVYRHYY